MTLTFVIAVLLGISVGLFTIFMTNQLVYAYDTAINPNNLTVSVRIVNSTPGIEPFQIKLVDLDTGLMNVEQSDGNIGNEKVFSFSLPNVGQDDKLMASVQQYDTSQILCQDWRTVALQNDTEDFLKTHTIS
jgi:hypothetical protein